ncbi:protein kinase domain-containing protein [Pseudorhodoferax sp.]|uniref:protein kinase domain-containing protein n=1 Tax=Pseudorhodoferax sp. TaxID=1993553 RepID=UPI0039E4D2DE
MRPPPDMQTLRQLNQLLAAALDLPPERRDAWLTTLPPDHRPLLPQLRAMLARAALETDDFLQRGAPALLAAQGLVEDAPGDRIGPYLLVAELGRGGMSTVWRARRCDGGLQREVALKLPHASWAHGFARRMARERDILATLEHPHIARLYDAGLTEQGRPWLAMACVDGQPINQHCHAHRLGVPQRLQLFLQVADAVAYAHSRLVVHRDLKPSNILVTPQGEVCLLDFGIAKLLDDDDPAMTDLTRQLGRPITPDYAAPEYLGNHPVGTLADVFSLGVVLYELLVGQRPYTLGPRVQADMEEALHQVRVVPPSLRAGDAATRRALRGDLDTIVHKALRVSTATRYPSVEALAGDIRRHLQGEPVLAQPPSWRYRGMKFLRRRRLPLAVAALVLASLLAGLGAALWQASHAREQAQRAEQARQFVTSILRHAQPRQGAAGAVLAADLLAVAGERIEQELAAEPRVAAELGVVVGEGLAGLGDPSRGAPALRAAVARATLVHGPRHPLSIHARALLAQSLELHHPDEAGRIADALVPDALAGLPTTAADAVLALRSQALQHARRGDAPAAYATLQQAIALAEQHLGPRHEQTVLTMGLLASTYGRFYQHRDQLGAAEEARARAEASLGALRPQVTLALVERWYGAALRSNDRPADAVPILRRVLQDQRVLDGSDTPRVHMAMYQLGLALSETGKINEALVLLSASVAIDAQQRGEDNLDQRDTRAALAGALGYARFADEAHALSVELELAPRPLRADASPVQIAQFLRHAQMQALRNEADAAAQMVQEAVQRIGEAQAGLRAEAWAIAALNARLQRRTDEAIAHARRAWDDPGRTATRRSGQAVIAAELASAWLDRGDAAQAAPWVRQSLALFEQAQVEPSPRSAPAWVAQARLLLHERRAAEALRVLEPLLASWRAVHPDSAWHGEALHWSARALAQLGHAQDARRQRLAAAALLATSPLPMLRALASNPG